MMKNKKFTISILILLLGQAFFYAFLKFFQTEPNYLLISLDEKIPFLKHFVYVYNSFYPFVFLTFYYLFKRDEVTYFEGIIAGVIGYLLCDVIFVLYPTIMVRPVVPDNNTITNFFLKLTYFFDEPALNCFPSIHCLFTFQVIWSILKSDNILKTPKILLTLYSFLIIMSTVFIKQHYILDIFGALVICLFANLVVTKFDLYKKLKIRGC